MQDATGYAPLATRTRLAKQAARVETIGAVVMLAAPIIMLLAKSPAILLLEIAAGLFLPELFDPYPRRDAAGGARCQLPPRLAAAEGWRLHQGRGRPGGPQHPHGRSLHLRPGAAAISLLDVMRWLRVLRF